MQPVEHPGSGASDGPQRSAARVILIDDHAILRDGLRALLDLERDIAVIGEAGALAEGIALAQRLQPDIAIIDISFPVGSASDAIRTLHRDCESIRVIVLTVHNTDECLRIALQAGANGFVAKDASYEILLRAVRFASSKDHRTAQSLPSALLRGRLTLRQHEVSIPKLTAREHQVLVGVAQGYSSKEIAAKLGRSVKTIVKHRSNMMRKLSLHDASSATRFALANGFL